MADLMTVKGPQRLLIVSDVSLPRLRATFVTRGFVVAQRRPVATNASEEQADVVVLDLDAPGANQVLAALVRSSPRPILVGLAPVSAPFAETGLDAVFESPIDPDAVFSRVTTLLHERETAAASARRPSRPMKAGQPSPQPSPPVARGTPEAAGTGPTGNLLFLAVVEELRAAVRNPRVGDILCTILSGMGCGPSQVTAADLQAVIASGRLLHALEGLGKRSEVVLAITRVERVIGNASPSGK